MKRSIYLSVIAAMLVLPMVTQAQTTQLRLSSYLMNNPVGKSIIREYVYPATISYVETGGEHVFFYNDGSLSLKKVPVDMSLTVNDFVIHGGSVYFCGERGGQGVFGYFNVNTFFNVNQMYYLTGGVMNTTTSTVATLKKMVVYNNSAGDLELVAVGKTAGNLDCVAELQRQGVWQYRYVLNGRSNNNNANLVFCEKFMLTYNGCLPNRSLSTYEMYMSEKNFQHSFNVTSFATMAMNHEVKGTVQSMTTVVDCQ